MRNRYPEVHDEPLDEQHPEPEFEVYWFDERIGSERVEAFYTQAAADEFRKRLPGHYMAH